MAAEPKKKRVKKSATEVKKVVKKRKYKNDRAKYIDAFFKLICWSTSNERFLQDQY